jgi:adenylate cyclase
MHNLLTYSYHTSPPPLPIYPIQHPIMKISISITTIMISTIVAILVTSAGASKDADPARKVRGQGHNLSHLARRLRKKSSRGRKCAKSSTISFDPADWCDFQGLATDFDEGYLGDYETIDTTEIRNIFSGTGAAFIIDLGSSSSSFRRRGAVVSLSETRAIWNELSPIVEDNDGIVMKSNGDSLYLYFENVSDGLAATRAMYLALIVRWRKKVELACDVAVEPTWCGNEEEERKRFFNTASVGGGYGEMLLIGEDGKHIDAFGNPVNNAFFAGKEEAEHGEFRIDEDALQRLLEEAEVDPQDNACSSNSTSVDWKAGTFDINRFIVRSYGNFCYYTVCFDANCTIPDDQLECD